MLPGLPCLIYALVPTAHRLSCRAVTQNLFSFTEAFDSDTLHEDIFVDLLLLSR